MSTPNYSHLLQQFWSPTAPMASTTERPTESTAAPIPDLSDLLAENLLWQETLLPQEAELVEIPTNLPTTLMEALQAQGITHLYSHQRRSLKVIRLGKDLILTTNTASGKTLSVYPGILEGCMRQGYRALAFYGLKALAFDQYQKLSNLLATMPNPPVLAQLTGDTTQVQREAILASEPHIIAATPELIHYQLRQAWKSDGWARFWQQLHTIVLDEAHTFAGVYGANMALLLKRIRLAVDHYGGDSKQLQYIFLSATIGNPVMRCICPWRWGR